MTNSLIKPKERFDRLPRWPARKWIAWLEELGFVLKPQRRGSGHFQMEHPSSGQKVTVPAPRRKGDVLDPVIASRIVRAALKS